MDIETRQMIGAGMLETMMRDSRLGSTSYR